jgi:DNA-directed RNA polymerase specialized sigma24 family protein
MSNPAANEVSRDTASLIPYSRNFARRFCRDASDDNDLVQETLVYLGEPLHEVAYL